MTVPHQARPARKDGTFWARIQQCREQNLESVAIVATGLIRYATDVAAIIVFRAKKRAAA
jgi:hypothetical protein